MPETLDSAALAGHRQVLFRYALLQLQDAALADDAVQETLLAALESADGFSGRSGVRTWLIGILKHKIADHWRQHQREDAGPLGADDGAAAAEDGGDELFFAEDGHWASKPAAWASPEAALGLQEFWAVYEFCQNNLPPLLGKVFMLREIVGLDAAEVRQETGITEANYWVAMHRARLRLRECLEQKWFVH